MNEDQIFKLNMLIQGVWRDMPDTEQLETLRESYSKLIVFLDENIPIEGGDEE